MDLAASTARMLPPPIMQLHAWLGALAALGVLWLWGLSIFYIIIGRNGLKRIQLADALCLSLALGLPASSIIVLLIGQIQNAMRHVPWIAMGAAGWALMGTLFWQRRRIFDSGMGTEHAEGISRVQLIGGILLGLSLVMLVFPALCPSSSYDVLEYHLGMVSHAFDEGHVTPIPHVFYTAQPLATEMFYLLAALGEGAARGHAPGVAQWGMIILLMMLVLRAARHLSIPAAWRPWLALLMLTHPVLLPQLLDRFTDWTGAVMLGAGFLVWSIVRASRRSSESPPLDNPFTLRAALLLMGVMAGGSVDAKWTNLATVAAPLAVMALDIGAAGGLIWFALSAFAIWLPWGIWLAVIRGNPFAPFLASLFTTAQWPPERLQFLIETHGPLHIWQWEFWSNLGLRLGSRLAGLPLFAWSLGGLAICLGACKIARRPVKEKKDKAHKSSDCDLRPILLLDLAIVIATLGWGGLRDAATRFLTPTLLPAVLAMGLEIKMFTDWRMEVRPARRRIATCLIVILSGGALLFRIQDIQWAQGYGSASFAYATHPEHAAAVWRAQVGIVEDMYNAIAGLPSEAHIIAVDEARSYPMLRAVDVASVFDASPMRRAVSGATSGEQIRERLLALGYTHLLVNEFEMLRILGVHTPTGLLHDAPLREWLRVYSDVQENPVDRIKAGRMIVGQYWGYTEFSVDPLTAGERRAYGEFLSERRAKALWVGARKDIPTPAMWIAPLN